MNTSIRCPNTRPHGKYELCGRLLGVLKDNKILLYCEDCKEFFEINLCGESNIEMKLISKSDRLKLKTGLRAIIK